MTTKSLLVGLTLSVIAISAAPLSSVESLIAEGDVAVRHGRLADAEKAYLEAIEEAKKTPGDLPRQPMLLNSLAAVYSMEGRYPEAESLCQRAITILGASVSPADPALANILNTLATVELHFGQYSKAEQYVQRAIATDTQHLPDRSAELLADYTTLGVALCARGKCKQADQVLRQGLQICMEGPACQVVTVAARSALAGVNVSRKRYLEAEQNYRKALEILELDAGPSNAIEAPILSDLAMLYADTKQFSKAEATGRSALEIASKELSDSDAAAKAALALGQALAGQGRFEAAEPYFKQEVTIHERAQGPKSVEYALALQQYAQFLRKNKRISEASLLETRAHELLFRAGQKVDIAEFPAR